MLAHQAYDDLQGRYTESLGGTPSRGGPVSLAHQAYDDLRRKIHSVTRGTIPTRPSLACSSDVR